MGGGTGLSSSGVAISAVSSAALAPSGGVSVAPLAAGGVEILLGTALQVHGSMMMASGTKNLSQKKGHLKEDNKSKRGGDGKKVADTPSNNKEAFTRKSRQKSSYYVNKKTGEVFKKNRSMHPDEVYNVWKNEKRFNKNKLRDHSVYANTGAKRPSKSNK